VIQKKRAVAEIDEFLQQVLADQREWDADPTPQTPAYALLAAGRVKEAETLAHKAVSELETDNAATSERIGFEDQSSPAENNARLNRLADALIAHGIALARSKKLEAAQVTLERAIAVAQEAGAPDKAGLGALTMIEELEQLSRESLLSAYEQASVGMAKMRNRKLQWRVIGAAKKVMASFRGEIDPDRALEILLARPTSSPEQIVTSKGTLIIELNHRVVFKKRTAVRRRSRKND
jgi:tetratricopeptide (TPR) repeat protein